MTFLWHRTHDRITSTCTCGARIHASDETALLRAQRSHLHQPLIRDTQTAGRRTTTTRSNTVTKFQSAMPKDHGLTNRVLVDDPETVRVIVALIDVAKVVTDVDSGDQDATVRILSAEFVNTADETDARKMMAAATTKRTGRTVLEGLDFATGEVR